MYVKPVEWGKGVSSLPLTTYSQAGLHFVSLHMLSLWLGIKYEITECYFCKEKVAVHVCIYAFFFLDKQLLPLLFNYQFSWRNLCEVIHLCQHSCPSNKNHHSYLMGDKPKCQPVHQRSWRKRGGGWGRKSRKLLSWSTRYGYVQITVPGEPSPSSGCLHLWTGTAPSSALRGGNVPRRAHLCQLLYHRLQDLGRWRDRLICFLFL